MGLPWIGHLQNGVELAASPVLRRITDTDAEDHFWGTTQLVGLVERAARAVHRAHGGTGLLLGELSAQAGGDLVGHRSHENGRDADIGLYLLDENGQPIRHRSFIEVDLSGHGVDTRGRAVQFDDARNWALVEAIAKDSEAVAQYMIIHRRLKLRLLAYGRSHGASPAAMARAERVLVAPVGVRNPHRNHFHLRIFCDSSDVPACRDRRPYWPWLPTTHPFRARAWEVPGSRPSAISRPSRHSRPPRIR